MKRILLLGVSFIFLTACTLLNPSTPAEEAASGEGQPASVMLTCNQACADRGQCGVAPDQSQVVLGHPDQPTVTLGNHAMRFPSGSTATILDTRALQISSVASSEQIGTADFFFVQVQTAETFSTGWVAAWCTETP